LIERSQISHICLTYDIPYPREYSLDATEEPLQSLLGMNQYPDVTIDHLSEEEEEEILYDELTPGDALLDHRMIQSETSYHHQKSPEELIEDKRHEIERLKKLLLQLEDELDNSVQVEDFNLADSINSQITAINQRKSELESWISQNNIF